MSIELKFHELKALLSGSIFEGCFHGGASQYDFDELERRTNIAVVGGLRTLWSLANGAEYRQYGTPVFGVETDELTPCGFLSISEAIETRQRLLDEWAPFVEDLRLGDTRIAKLGINPGWIPFGEFNGEGTVLFYDSAPGPKGTVGQVIAFQHDPDGMYCLASSFDEFFSLSNRLLKDGDLNSWINDE